MEGITGYVYRKAFNEFFGPLDRYYIPFIAPTQNKKFASKALKDVAPDNNPNMVAIPQVLTNKSDQFIFTAQALADQGYDMVNLNLGCPSATVVSKKKGSGFLGDLDLLDQFMADIFSKSPIKISVKTRLGIEDPQEFHALLDLFNKYPMEELIIHPRTQKDYYKNTPHLDMFQMALDKAKMPLVYNGDIFTKKDFQAIHEAFPQVDAFMLGRGLLGNPNLVRDILGQAALSKDQLKGFHDSLMAGYQEVMSGDRPVLYKMKELWFYMIHLFDDPGKSLKKIRKSQKLSDYKTLIDLMFAQKNLTDNGPTFHDAIKGIRK